jgi:hypothetical protein
MKKVVFIFSIAIVQILLILHNVTAAPILIGWDGGLHEIDIQTAEHTRISTAPSEYRLIESLAFQPDKKILYGVVNNEPDTTIGGGNLLVSIDTKGGEVSDIGFITGFYEITAMTYDETTNIIYALDQTTRTLLSIDPLTASPTTIGHFSYGSSNALAADPTTGQLYASLMGLLLIGAIEPFRDRRNRASE